LRSFRSSAPRGSSRRRTRGPLLHPAGELRRAAVRLGREPDPLKLLADPALDLVLARALPLQAEGDVLLHAQMREQRVALEHGVGGPLVGRNAQHVRVVDRQPPVGDILEAGDHPQGCRLATAARAEHGEELALGDVEVDRVDSGEIAELLRDGAEDDAWTALLGRLCAHSRTTGTSESCASSYGV
jgi:hypothetical protein